LALFVVVVGMRILLGWFGRFGSLLGLSIGAASVQGMVGLKDVGVGRQLPFGELRINLLGGIFGI
jgi:hypothetical protein